MALLYYRPPWTAQTTPRELQRLENEAFLNWRRSLALFQESNDILITPYEKNLEMWRQLWRVLEKSQIVIQILDARNPLLFYCEDVFTYSREIDPLKRHFLLINKADLLTSSQRLYWHEYFTSKNLDVIFYSASPQSVSIDLHSVDEKHRVWEKDELVEFFEMEGQRVDSPTVTIGLVGYPNVGKSSTINSLFSSKKVSVAMTPGKTKHYQTLFLTPEVCLCDCPGLVFPNFSSSKAELVVNGILPIDQLREYISPCQLVANRIRRPILEKIYGIQLPLTAEQFERKVPLDSVPPSASQLLSAHATARGFKTSFGGNPDESRSARFVLKDYVSVGINADVLRVLILY